MLACLRIKSTCESAKRITLTSFLCSERVWARHEKTANNASTLEQCKHFGASGGRGNAVEVKRGRTGVSKAIVRDALKQSSR